MMALIRMRLIGIQPGVIVTNLVRARKAGLPFTVDQMQSHYLAGGNVENVTLAMIAAQRAQIPLEWQRAAAIDLAGRNVLEALQTSVNPRVIETPIFQGVAQNGIQLNVKARITVRTQPRPLRRRRGRADDRRARRRRRRLGRRRGRRSQGSARVSRPHFESGAGEGPRRGHGLRDRVDRHRRRRRRQEHRRGAADVAGRSRPAHRAGQGGRTPVQRAGGRTRAEGPDASDARQGRGGRSADSAGDRRSVPRGQSRHHGLLQLNNLKADTEMRVVDRQRRRAAGSERARPGTEGAAGSSRGGSRSACSSTPISKRARGGRAAGARGARRAGRLQAGRGTPGGGPVPSAAPSAAQSKRKPPTRSRPPSSSRDARRARVRRCCPPSGLPTGCWPRSCFPRCSLRRLLCGTNFLPPRDVQGVEMRRTDPG